MYWLSTKASKSHKCEDMRNAFLDLFWKARDFPLCTSFPPLRHVRCHSGTQLFVILEGKITKPNISFYLREQSTRKWMYSESSEMLKL